LEYVADAHPRVALNETRGSRRSIRLTASAVEALERHRERQESEGAARGDGWNAWGLAFCTRRGTPIRRDNLHSKSWKPLLRRAGLPDVRFHNLRHTCATLLLTKGVHPKIVSEMLGHSSIAITLDTYSHVIPGLGDAAAGAMEDALT
jgi:integrase